jgi:hypothetical protein
MIKFKSVYDYIRFESRTIRRFRHFRDAETDEFLATVLATAARRSSILKKGEIVWRAQLGSGETNVTPHADGSATVEFHPLSETRMKPLAECAREGRTNAKGIPVLYVAADPETAMSEVRPSLASELSLAKLEICRDLKILDCSIDSSSRSPLDFVGQPSPSADECEQVVWGAINDAFARPVDLSDSVADYAPTQVMAEYFKGVGYNGIRYQSRYRTAGQNVAIFDLADANIRNVKLMRVRSINIEFTDW